MTQGEHYMDNLSNRYPDRNQCLEILNGAGCSQEIIKHILAVTELALRIASRFPKADRSLIEAGALLHDLGRAQTHGIRHGVVGGKLARQLGLPTDIVNIIERHLGAGITKLDAVKNGLPAKDFIPITLEERIVAHADNLIDFDKRCTIQQALAIFEQKGLSEVAKRVKQLHLTLSQEAGIDLDKI